MSRLRLSHVAWVLGLLAAAAVIIPSLGKTSACGPQTKDVSNLRQIAQASLIYTVDHDDQLPQATDVWEYAYHIAQFGGADLPEFWVSKLDPAWNPGQPNRIAVGKAPQSQLDPRFRNMKLSIAVPLGKLDTTMPGTTPIAWTRGLQPDGTWAKHSPYGTHGGYIAFLNGGVQFFKTLTSDGGQLIRFDQSGRTANIIEALPSGTRIGEYLPTADEQKTWSSMKRPSPR
jgi:hypothetical protein